MSRTVSKSHLESLLATLNESLGVPVEPYRDARDSQDRLVSNPDTFVLDWAYGGVRLSRMCRGGGERDISPRGTKRECFEYMHAILKGIEFARESGV